jgi:hypothetical protein
VTLLHCFIAVMPFLTGRLYFTHSEWCGCRSDKRRSAKTIASRFADTLATSVTLFQHQPLTEEGDNALALLQCDDAVTDAFHS